MILAITLMSVSSPSHPSSAQAEDMFADWDSRGARDTCKLAQLPAVLPGHHEEDDSRDRSKQHHHDVRNDRDGEEA